MFTQPSKFRCYVRQQSKAETISEFSTLSQQYVGKKKKTAEDSAEAFVYYVGNGFDIP